MYTRWFLLYQNTGEFYDCSQISTYETTADWLTLRHFFFARFLIYIFQGTPRISRGVLGFQNWEIERHYVNNKIKIYGVCEKSQNGQIFGIVDNVSKRKKIHVQCFKKIYSNPHKTHYILHPPFWVGWGKLWNHNEDPHFLLQILRKKYKFFIGNILLLSQ